MHISDRTPEGVKVLKTYLYYAEFGRFPSDYVQEENFDSKFEQSVYNYLTANDYKVEKRVGCAGYRIDLAIIDPNNDDEYILGIECDGSAYNENSSARERDRIRQNVLEGLGWNFYRIWSTDWYHNRQNAKQNLIQAINEAIRDKEKTVKPLEKVNDETIVVNKIEENTGETLTTISEDNDENSEVQQLPDENIIEKVTDTPIQTQKSQNDEKTVEVKSVDDFDEIFEVLDEEDKFDGVIPDISDVRTSKTSEEIREMQDISNEIIEEVKKSESESVSDKEDDETEGTEEKPLSVEEKVQSKIQVQKVEVEKTSTESDYTYYENNIDCENFYDLNDSDVIKVIEEIIRMESPIHREEIYNRLKKVYNVKATKKFKTTIDLMISSLLQSSQEIYVKNNYYYIFQKDVVVRKRIKPNIDYISDDEIIEAITQVLILNNSVKINELSKQVSKLLGFKILSGKTSNKLNEVISFLRFSEKISIDSDSIVTLNDTK